MKFFIDIYNWLHKTFKLPLAFSWQTLFLLSVFSYFMAWLSSGIIQELLINFGWIFLIFGTFWATSSSKLFKIGNIHLSPWITGALVSIYIFSELTGELPRQALVFWPTISAIIASLPDLIDVASGFKLKAPSPQKRQDLVLLFGTQFVLSCWFQFDFVLQDWVAQYPSVLADDFRQSAFVYKVEAPLSSSVPEGAVILDEMEANLAKQLNARPWSEVERLLLEQERVKLINTVAQQTKQQQQIKQQETAFEALPVVEYDLWQIASDVSARTSGYNLELQAIWQGPRSERETDYSIRKNCQIVQVAPPVRRAATATPNAQPTQPPAPISNLTCEPAKGWGVEQPILATEL